MHKLTIILVCDNLFDDVSLDKQVDSFMKIETLTFLPCIMIGWLESDGKKVRKKRKKVHFGRTMHCLPQRLKSTFFEKISSGWSPSEGNLEQRKNFPKR